MAKATKIAEEQNIELEDIVTVTVYALEISFQLTPRAFTRVASNSGAMCFRSPMTESCGNDDRTHVWFEASGARWCSIMTPADVNEFDDIATAPTEVVF